jgi:hypothetical protein
MANRRLNFFNKSGNPLNFEYVGPTGPTPLDLKFLYFSVSSTPALGKVQVNTLDTASNLVFNKKDSSGFDITNWATEAATFLTKGAEVYITLSILPNNSFRGKVSSVTIGSSTVTIVFSETQGQTIISEDRRIKVETSYKYRPGGYFKGDVYFDPVSAGLYENEQIFIIQQAYGRVKDVADWSLISQGASTDGYYVVDLCGNNRFLAAGYKSGGGGGLIVRSFNGGVSFSEVSTPFNKQQIFDLSWNKLTTGGQYNTIFVTLWNGSTSSSIILMIANPASSLTLALATSAPAVPPGSARVDLRSVCFVADNSNTAIAVGRSYSASGAVGTGAALGAVIYRTTDFGVNWTNVAIPGSVVSDLRSVKFKNGNGIIVGSNGTIFYSSDSGSTWTAATCPVPGASLLKVHLLASGTGWACGAGGVVIKTYNYGQTWIELDNGYSQDILGIYFENEIYGYAVGTSGLIIGTVDGGTTWTTQKAQTVSQNLYAVYSNNDLGYPGVVLGDSRTVFNNQYNVELSYMYPRIAATGGTGLKRWRTRWESDNYGDVDVSETIFTYRIQEGLPGSQGYPLIVSYPNMSFNMDSSVNDYWQNGYVVSGATGTTNSSAFTLNVAINANDVYADVYERKLIIEELAAGTPEKVAEINFYGEVVGEDERFKVMLQNVGRLFTPEDANILRNSDPEEPIPNYLEINEKRKELLLEGDQIYNYIGAYRGLINALKFFEYQDLRIKEYWLNLTYNSVETLPSIVKTQAFLDQYNNPNGGEYTQNHVVSDILDNANKGKYRLEQTYGPDKDGFYRLDVSSEATLVPSRTFKKTSMFGLYYDINKVSSEVDGFGYPVVNDAFLFTQEEVLIKLFALKERLKKTYLPLNAKIIDITGEGVYFSVYNTKAWTDTLAVSDITSGFYLDIASNPDFGFIEDLRAFSTRPSSLSLQTPLDYFDGESIDVFAIGTTGGSGGAFILDGLSSGATGFNPSIELVSGKTYTFNISSYEGSTPLGEWNFTISSTNPAVLPFVQTDPTGLTGNGSTGSSPVVWNIPPQGPTTVYYYSSIGSQKQYLKGQINILSPEVSDLGNLSDPLSGEQSRSAEENLTMLQAISDFYQLKENGQIQKLGDGLQDPPRLDPSTGSTYVNPLGMPVVLELLTDIWTWEEMGNNWSSLTLPVARIGDIVFVREYQIPDGGLTGGVYGEVTSIDYSNGEYTVEIVNTALTVDVGAESIVAPYQEFMLLTWANLDFSNMIEIEWIISKMPSDPGLPYSYEFRGDILSYYKFATFLPFVGRYKVQCNVYDAFNAKTTVIKNNLIQVSPANINIDAWTRYRQVEYYDWDQVYRQWDDYASIWEYPAEGSTYQQVEKEIPQELLTYASFGNNTEEGQSIYVGVMSDPLGATGYFAISQSQVLISSVTVPTVLTSSYGDPIITTASNHNLSDGDSIYIVNTDSVLYGEWVVNVLSATTFSIELSITTAPTLTGSEAIVKISTLDVYINDRLIGSCINGETLYQTTNSIVASVNSLRTSPDYYASCPDASGSTTYIEIKAPDSTGSAYNGVTLSVGVTGYINLVDITPTLTGGTGSFPIYEFWNETSDNYPDPSLKYWGTKKLNWDAFDSIWKDGYAHSWEDYSYNNEWLGGFELHTACDGDHILVSLSSDTYPLPVGVTFDAATGGRLTFSEAISQLNDSSDEFVTNFHYSVSPLGFESLIDPKTSKPYLCNTPDLINTSASIFVPQTSAAPAPPGR